MLPIMCTSCSMIITWARNIDHASLQVLSSTVQDACKAHELHQATPQSMHYALRVKAATRTTCNHASLQHEDSDALPGCRQMQD